MARPDHPSRPAVLTVTGLAADSSAVRLLTTFAALLGLGLLATHAVTLYLDDVSGAPLRTDFSAFWGAARLALENGPLAPFDDAALTKIRRAPPGDPTSTFLWLYPPTFLGFLAPFGALPFTVAWLLFAILSAGALAFALRCMPGVRWTESLLVLCAPATLLTLVLGQNAALTCAIVIGALEALRRGRPMLAGLVIAALTIKPQLGVMIPVALAAERRWRAFAAAAVFSVLLTGLGFAVVGAEYFSVLLESSHKIRNAVTGGALGTLMISTFGIGIAFGLPVEIALGAQLLQTIAVAALLWRLWRRDDAGFDRKAAAVLFAIPLATPYALHYELVFAVAGAAYLVRAGGETAATRLLLTALWLTPVIGSLLHDGIGFVFATPLVLAAFLTAASQPAAAATMPKATAT